VTRDGSRQPRQTWTGAILAGGRARRLGGRDKASLIVGGRRIIDRQLDALRSVTPHLLVVTNDRDRFVALDIPVVADAIAGAGPLGGIYTALVSAATAQVLVLACDMPFVVAPLLSHLAAVGAGFDAAVPRLADGPHPLCASYSSRCLPRIEAALRAGRFKVQDVLDGLDVLEVTERDLAPFGDPAHLLANVNSEEDYVRLSAAESVPHER
jgi:molybdopterin-guanine dinucleotide biosynthesis protein A